MVKTKRLVSNKIFLEIYVIIIQTQILIKGKRQLNLKNSLQLTMCIREIQVILQVILAVCGQDISQIQVVQIMEMEMEMIRMIMKTEMIHKLVKEFQTMMKQ